MSSISQCWLCPSTFATRKELRAHIGSSNHLRLRVLCPWCYDGEKTSNRVGDLKRHVATKHAFDKLFGDKFFSDGNGFYLAMFPKDYARIITPTPPSSQEAIQAMEAVKSWTSVTPSSSRSLQEWKQGWALGDATPTREEPSGVDPRSPARGDEAPPYSPTRPEMVAGLVANQFLVGEDGIELDIIQGSAYFIVKLNSSVRQDMNRMETLKRSVVNRRARPTGTFTTVTGALHEELSRKASQLTQISAMFIDCILTIKPEPGRLPHPFPKATQPCLPIAPVTQTPASGPSAPKIQPPSLPPPPKTPQQQARDLLSWGVMPLIPPARRNWDQDEAVTLQGRQTSLKWPPRGWRTFTAERKLQCFEHASALLDSDLSGFPVSSKKDLLDRYNFLALPGSAPRQQTAKSGMRHGNYVQLRDIATEKDNDMRVLKMFGNAARDRENELDSMIRLINGAGIRLRLEK